MLKIQIKLSNKMHSENSVENAIILTRRGVSLGGDMTVNNKSHEENYNLNTYVLIISNYLKTYKVYWKKYSIMR